MKFDFVCVSLAKKITFSTHSNGYWYQFEGDPCWRSLHDFADPESPVYGTTFVRDLLGAAVSYTHSGTLAHLFRCTRDGARRLSSLLYALNGHHPTYDYSCLEIAVPLFGISVKGNVGVIFGGVFDLGTLSRVDSALTRADREITDQKVSKESNDLGGSLTRNAKERRFSMHLLRITRKGKGLSDFVLFRDGSVLLAGECQSTQNVPSDVTYEGMTDGGETLKNGSGVARIGAPRGFINGVFELDGFETVDGYKLVDSHTSYTNSRWVIHDSWSVASQEYTDVKPRKFDAKLGRPKNLGLFSQGCLVFHQKDFARLKEFVGSEPFGVVLEGSYA